MATGARSMVLAAAVLAGFSATAASQTSRRAYEAFVRAEINKCVAEAVQLDKETGARNRPTHAERVASCREMMLQIHDLYPQTEPRQKTR